MQGRRVVAVAGTHGKTTTTSLLTVALQHCGADPSFAIGGELNETGSNAHDGSGDLFVAEADESDGAFLVYSPHGALVTNVEADHLDNYGTEEAYRAAFDTFLDRIAPDGLPGRVSSTTRAPTRWSHGASSGAAASYAWGSAATPTCAPRTCASTAPTSTLRGGRPRAPARRGAPCRSRAATTCSTRWPRSACGLRLGFAFADLARGLGAFTGTRRRMELKGEVGGRPGLRQLRPPPQRDRRRPPGRPVARR